MPDRSARALPSLPALPTAVSARHLHRIARFLHPRQRLTLLLLLTPPLLWFGVVYVGSLLGFLGQSLLHFDEMAMSVTPELTLANFQSLLAPANYDIVLRTLGMAVAVTLGTVLIGFPMAYYMAHHAGPREKAFFYISVMLPMWASYIIKAYAWTVLLAQGGVIYWALTRLGLRPVLDSVLALPLVGGETLATSNLGRFLVFTYIWLPFMVLPIQAAIERVPANLLLASADLGARPLKTLSSVLWPLAFPGVVAGSIFTFSLTLGDYIIPQLIGPPGLFMGNMVYTLQGTIGNLPLAAAFTCVPIVLITLYLSMARRLGAFDAL